MTNPFPINDATAQYAGTIAWTHDGAGSLSANSIINPVYTPATADAGNVVTLTLIVFGEGYCNAASASSTMQITVAPIAGSFLPEMMQ